MSSVMIQICSFLYILLLLFVYFSKKRLDVLENKIYKLMMIANFFGLIFDVISVFTIRIMDIIPLINMIICKIYLLYLLTFMFLFTIYIFTISVKDKSKEKLKINKIIKLSSIIYLIFIVITMSLPLYFNNSKDVIYSYGPSANFLYFVSGLCMFNWIICMIFNYKNVKSKKYYPVYAFFLIGGIVTCIQKVHPELLLMTSMESFIIMMMYFTIENPDLKQLEEVTKNNEITEQAYIDKSNFIFEMTQEVREPLSYIKNTSKELVDNDYKKEEYKEGLNYIYNASRQLDFVVNDVLNVSSLDVQKVKFLNNRYNLDMIYEDLIKRVESSISKNVEFRYNMPNNVPYLYGDNIKLKQVLYSILMNSVKKTEKGFIEFNIDTIEKYDVCRVIFRIIDSGVGIGIDKINEILSTTSELNKDDIVNLQKSEFNIELCQKIIKSLGGNLLIKSKLGKGTEVILTIDQKIYREKEDNFNLFNNYSNKRVLVVSQDKKVNEVIKKVFNESDINASYILYGADAIDRIKSGKKYDYIIIEDDMKEMSGYETLKRLKRISRFNVPCIVILDSNKENIKKHYIEDGFNDYILTSDLRNELKRIIEKY